MGTPSETHQLPATGHRAPAWAARAGGTPWRGIAIIAVAAFAVEMAVSARYGYVRDELYFLSAGHHLAFGFVDQPPLTPLLARLGEIVGQGTLAGLRVLPPRALAALVLALATISRMLGAARRGQLLAVLTAATCGAYLGAMHELTTTPPDFVFWTATLLLVTKLLASQDPRCGWRSARARESPARPSGTSPSCSRRSRPGSSPPMPGACCAAGTCWPGA